MLSTVLLCHGYWYITWYSIRYMCHEWGNGILRGQVVCFFGHIVCVLTMPYAFQNHRYLNLVYLNVRNDYIHCIKRQTDVCGVWNHTPLIGNPAVSHLTLVLRGLTGDPVCCIWRHTMIWFSIKTILFLRCWTWQDLCVLSTLRHPSII